MDKKEEHGLLGGHSRRAFLKGVSGAIGGAALLSPELLHASEEKGSTTRSGIARYSADGAKIQLKVNGQMHQLTVTPSTTLLDALREQLNLTGSKEVCDRGACGACTVLMNGRSVNGCMTLAIDAVGAEIVTVEGLAQGDRLDPVQRAFAAHDACQCGFCIPGFVVRSRALLDETPKPSMEQIKHGLSGNICRCAAYVRIFEAVDAAGKGAV